MSENGLKFKKVICFCDKKIKKAFKCDWFQIIPIENYIDKNVKTKHYPFILEYNYNEKEIVQISNEDIVDEDTSDFFSELNHEHNVMNYILRLLSVVTNHYFFTYGTDQGWFVNLNGKREEDFKCQYGFKVYSDKNFKNTMYITKFSPLEFDLMDRIKHSKYYTHPNIDNEHENELTIGEYTESFFNSLKNLDSLQKEYFDSAVTLINNGMKIRNEMKSLAFLAFVSSIETMTHLESKINKEEIEFECNSCKKIKSSSYNCKQCGSPIWGISQQIKKYLKKYLSPSEDLNKVINKLYGRRSKIAHAGGLLMGDIFFDWNNPKKREEHFMELIACMQYSKMSLVNYVLYQKN